MGVKVQCKKTNLKAKKMKKTILAISLLVSINVYAENSIDTVLPNGTKISIFPDTLELNEDIATMTMQLGNKKNLMGVNKRDCFNDYGTLLMGSPITYLKWQASDTSFIKYAASVLCRKAWRIYLSGVDK